MARGSLSSNGSTALARPATPPDAPASQLVQDTTEPQRSAFWADGTLGVGAAFGGLGGFSNVFSRGVYETYRLMNHDPTLALARAMAKLPIKAATHSFEADDGVPDHVIEAVQKAVDPLWGDVVDAMCWALEYGWKSAELIWEYQGGALVPRRVKPLDVDTTQILVDAETGSYLGVRQGAVDLMRGKSLYYGNDVEDQNFYGQSRHENVRKLVWGPWQDLMKRMHTYFAKGAGVIPVVRYPIGTGADENGANDDNFKRARTIIDTLSGAAGVCFPFEATKQAIDAAIRSGGKLTDLAAWTIDFLEAKAGHGAEFESIAAYYDKLKFRGWLVPERAGMEGQHGTKAEAETHGDVGIGCAEETHKGICLRVGNEQLINPFLAYNFGPEMEGKVRMVPAPLVDDSKALVRDIVRSLLTNASAVDVLLSLTDVDAMLDQAGVPKGKQTVDPAELLRAKEQGDAPEDDGGGGPPEPGQPKKPMSPADQQKAIAASMERIHDALMRGGRTSRRGSVQLDCGTGAGGFKPGNDCAGEGGGGTATAAAPGADHTDKFLELEPPDHDDDTGPSGKKAMLNFVTEGEKSDAYHKTRLAGVEFVKEGDAAKSQYARGWKKVYEKTQSRLKDAGIESVKCYRGMVFPEDSPMGAMFAGKQIKAGDVVNVNGMTFNSWSTNDRSAGAYAPKPKQRGKVSVIFERVVPSKDIVASHMTQATMNKVRGEDELIAVNRGAMQVRIKEVRTYGRGMSAAPAPASEKPRTIDLSEFDDQRGIAPPDDVDLSLDCGTGAGGFKPGNTCGSEGGGGAPAISNEKFNSLKIQAPKDNAELETMKTQLKQVRAYTDQSDEPDAAQKKAYRAAKAEGKKFAQTGKDSHGWAEIHADTQAKLEAAGIDRVKAYRGMGIPANDPIAKAIAAGKIKPGDTIELKGLKFESFSDDPKVAGKFAQRSTMEGEKTAGLVFERVIERKDIVATHRTTSGFVGGENEVLGKHDGSTIKVRVLGVAPAGQDFEKGPGRNRLKGLQLSAEPEVYDVEPYSDQKGIAKAD